MGGRSIQGPALTTVGFALFGFIMVIMGLVTFRISELYAILFIFGGASVLVLSPCVWLSGLE